MILHSVLFTISICVATASQQPTTTKQSGKSFNVKDLLRELHTKSKRPEIGLIVDTLKLFQKNVFTLEKALTNIDDESLQQELRNELGEYYYRIGKLFSEATSEQCSDILAADDVLVIKDPSRSPKDMIIENAIIVLGLSVFYRAGSDDAQRLLSELEAKKRKKLGDTERSMSDLKAMKASDIEQKVVEAERLMSDLEARQGHQPIHTAIARYQNAIVKKEQFLGTREGQDVAHQLSSELGDLYHLVGKALSQATDEECSKLVKERKVILLIDENAPAKDVILENAITALRTSLHYRPGVAEVENALSQLQEKQAATKASPAFVRALFDSGAEKFDEHLAALKYVAPQEVASEVGRMVEQRGRPFASALDAGCGTGLVGPLIRQYINGLLVGADLSPNMLSQARNLQNENGLPIYDDLNAGDLLSLDFRAKPFELIVAADVLVYFGDLEPILSRFKSLLEPGGVLIFSCERLETSDAGWTLTESARFSHGRQYVEETASLAGLRLLDYREIVPRYQAFKEVPGHLFVFQNDNY